MHRRENKIVIYSNFCKNLNITFFGVFSAVIAILTFTPLGYIPLGAVSATVLHIPVIIAAIVFGPVFGCGIGFVMGVLCLLKALTMPSAVTDVLFINPLISVLPRICIALVSSYAFVFLHNILKKYKLGQCFSIAISAVLGTLTNTILVLFFLILLYGDKISVALSQAVPYIIATVLALNGFVEIIIAVILAIPICSALLKLKDKMKGI